MASCKQSDSGARTQKGWLEKTGLKPTLGAKLAYAIVAGGDVYGKSERQKLKRNSKLIRLVTERGKDCERVYKTWRFPGSGLNLLQLAVVCDNYTAVRHMDIEFFVTKFEYKDYVVSVNDRTHLNEHHKDDIPKNHPVFLACYLGRRRILEELQSKIFLTTRQTDVTVTVHDPRCSPYTPVVHLPCPVRGSPLDLAALTGNVYYNEDLIRNFALSVYLKTALTVQDIESLWTVIDVVCAHGTTELASSFCSLLLTKPYVFRDSLLFNCQLFSVGRWSGKSSCLMECTHLPAIIFSVFNQKRLDLLPLVAAHLSRAQLSLVQAYLQDPRKPGKRPHCLHPRDFLTQCQGVCKRREAVVAVFQQEQRRRRLRDEAARVVLQSLGGNPRQLRRVAGLPPWLLELFEVPFQEVYHKLTSRPKRAL